MTLAAAREACIRLQGHDLATLGIDAPDTRDGTSTASKLADRVNGMPLTRRAEQTLPRHRDGDLLDHRLREDRVRRLVTESGGQPDALKSPGSAGPGRSIGARLLGLSQAAASTHA